MLKSILGGGKKRKAEQLIVQALVKLDDQNNADAQQAFRQAILLGQEKIAPYMKNLFSGFIKNHRYAEAIAIGKPLSSFYAEDPALFNDLGNQFRHLKDLEKAKQCYKKALQLNPKFELAYLNFSAMMAKVDRYDHDIQPLLDGLATQKDFVLPPYQGGKNLLKRMAKEVVENRGLDGALSDSQEISSEELLEHLKTKALNALNLAADNNPLAVSAAERHLANLVIAGIQLGKLAVSADGMQYLEKSHHSYNYYPLLRAILSAKQGQVDEAIDILKAEQLRKPDERYFNVNLAVALRLAGKQRQANIYLIRTGFLLEKSCGFFSAEEIENMAKEFIEKRRFKEALGLYQIIAETDPQPPTWLEMSRCLYFLKKLAQSTKVAKEGLGEAAKLGPKAKTDYANNATEFFETESDVAAKKQLYEQALALIESALFFDRNAERLDKAGQIAYKSGDSYKAAQFQEEANNLKGLNRAEQQEAKRQRYIKLGKEYMGQKKFQSAIHHFELAFDIKLDKDVFMFLASIYKRLKQPRALSNLMSRWKWMLEQEQEKNQVAAMKAAAEKMSSTDELEL